MARVQSLRAIRAWDGSQARAFEELCYQLRDASPPGATLTKLGNPDAGYEWYVRHERNGVEWGWQAKFAFNFETLRGLMEESLRTVVDKRPNCRRLTFCIPIDLPDARQGRERKSARQKFEDWKASVRERISGASRVRIELWQEGDILERLARPANRGRAWFFWDDQEVFGPEWSAERLRVTEQLAGERYTPEVNVELPIAFSLEGLGQSERFFDRYVVRRGAVFKEAKRVRANSHLGLGVTEELRTLQRAVERAALQIPARHGATDRFDRAGMLSAVRGLSELVDRAVPDRSADASGERRRNLRRRLDAFVQRLDELAEFLESPASRAAERGALLVTGEAGQGKTHLFCDAGRRALADGRPCVVLLAQRFSGQHVFTELAENLAVPARGASELLGAMAAAGEASGVPFVLLIDALNDSGDASGWQQELPALLAEAALHEPWVSVGVSVRSTYRSEIESAAVSHVPSVEHPGFAGFEQMAAQQYFAWHGLEQPRVPLLLPEFSNPLFLNVYCQALAEGSVATPEEGHVHISEVFDTYLRAKNERVSRTLRLDPYADSVGRAIDSLAAAMTGRANEWLPYDEAKALVDAHAPHLHAWPNTLFGQLLAEGVLTADIAYRHETDGEWRRVRSAQITFQRLADYRIAASLLSHIASADDLKAALGARRPLRQSVLDASAGVVEALAVLVPERFGVELLDAAQWSLRPHVRRRWKVATLASVSTRRDSAVTDSTARLLSRISGESDDLFERALRELVVVAARPSHPLNAEFLHRWLYGQATADRDASWGIATYSGMSEAGPLDRLIRWATAGPYPKYDERVIELACIPLCWTLSSPNRVMRDYVTKVLCALLAPRLPLMRKLLDRFARVNDPYVLERICVIAHGAILVGGARDPEAAVSCARRMADIVVDPATLPHVLVRDAARGAMEWCAREGLVTAGEHERVRPPYASEPPQRPRTLKQLEKAYERRPSASDVSPYGSLFYSIFGLGDFGRYVIESDVRRFSRYVRTKPRPPVRSGRRPDPDLAKVTAIVANLTGDQQRMWQAGDITALLDALPFDQRLELVHALHPPRRVVRRTYDAELAQRWVFERVLALGWTPERFLSFDHSYRIGGLSAGRSGHKPERFGKKYQWIAVHELLARIADNFHTSDEYGKDSPEYEGPWEFLGRHIDPTLPPAHRIVDEDGVESFSATFTDDEELWWVPEGPAYCGEQPAARAGWAEQPGDIPDMGSLLVRTDECGDAWVVLQAYYNWDEEPTPEQERYERSRRDLWAHFYSWIARRDDASQLFGTLAKRSLMGRWMPEGGDVTDAAYLPEMPWARAANSYPREWETVTFRDPPAPDVDVMPAWIGYTWEGNVWDCSIEESVSTTLPAPTLFDAGELRWRPVTCSWQDRSGSTVARHMRTEQRSALLVRADWLNAVLQRLECELVVGWLGEKQLHAAGIMGGLEGGWSEFTGVAHLRNGDWTVGRNRISVRHPVG